MTTDRMTIGEIIGAFATGEPPLRIEAYDGSAIGREDNGLVLRLKSERALQYFVTAPGDLGLARAYLMGELEVVGVHPGAPRDVFGALEVFRKSMTRRPDARTMVRIARSIGRENLTVPPIPEQEVPPPWQRVLHGMRRHSKARDSQSVSYHYDVSNRFYSWILGPTMAYTCACYPDTQASLETAQENKYRLVFDKLGLKAGDRLLDVGCGWGGMVRYAASRGVHVIGVTLSREQAEWGRAGIEADGLGDLAQVRLQDYRDVPERDFDAVSSIGMTEHIGRRNYHDYFTRLHGYLRPGGRLLNHCITRPDNTRITKAGGFIDRYIFPDGELAGAGTIHLEAENAGFEVVHEENLRQHYAYTLRDWCANLVDHWDEAVEEVGEPMAKLWGLYMGACQYGFEHNKIQLHQILAVRLGDTMTWDVPLRQWWQA
ncbi:cyclopropane-fatty-acyl-phospholipid synthase [Dietzia psychralcaliphila]|nr:cyclopropane-fatty-acyl-phospholipid synthase [Dietzia psychralcaliphila]